MAGYAASMVTFIGVTVVKKFASPASYGVYEGGARTSKILKFEEYNIAY